MKMGVFWAYIIKPKLIVFAYHSLKSLTKGKITTQIQSQTILLQLLEEKIPCSLEGKTIQQT